MVYGEVADAVQGLDQPLKTRPRFRNDAEWSGYAERLTRFARHTASRGVRLAYHHHMGAYVETAEDVDRLMALVGPEVGLLHDTGHATFAGGDAPAELRKHIARVVHVHCKDVRPAVARMARNRDWSFGTAVINGAFSTPGEGCVDFGAVIGILKDAGYRGWLVVEGEQDPAVAPSYRYADMSYRYLRALIDGASEAEARALAAEIRRKDIVEATP
jgi:inosose dehydratase